MARYTADALILRTYKLGEADRIVVFLTHDRGKRRGVAKGARRMRSRFAGGLETFTCARVAYVEREHRDLVRLTDVETLASPLVSRNVDVLEHVGYFAELIDQWALEGDPSQRLFRLGVSTLAALAADVPVDRVARYFEYWLLRLQGVYPSIIACQRCGADVGTDGSMVVAVREGGLRCRRCGPAGQGAELSAPALAFLRTASSVSPMHLGEVPLTARAAHELATAHRVLIGIHLDKELRSTRVLNALGAWSQRPPSPTRTPASASSRAIRQP